MSNPATLQAASQDRKARLAQLKSLQRKQEPQKDEEVNKSDGASRKRKSPDPSTEETIVYLSGRNYDAETKGPRLGFEHAPDGSQQTLEKQAKALAEESKRQQQEEAQNEQPIDLFKIQPKKPTWDLKRHLDKKLEVLNVRTDNAIARMVRERIQKAQNEAGAKSISNDQNEDGEGQEAIGIEGATLVEATRELEREDAQDSDEAGDLEDTEGG